MADFLGNVALVAFRIGVVVLVVSVGWYLATDSTVFESYRGWRRDRAEATGMHVCHVCGEMRKVRYVPPECLTVVAPHTYHHGLGYAVQVCDDCRVTYWKTPVPKSAQNASPSPET